MRTHAKIQDFLTIATLAAALTLYPSNAFAEDAKPGAKAPATAKVDMHGYDLIISGGLLIEPDGGHNRAVISGVVDALRKQYPDANIVVTPELSETSLGDLKLHAHELPEMLEALRVASGNKFDWTGPGSPGAVTPPSIDPATGLPNATVATPDPNSGLYILRPAAQAAGNERVVEAFNIAHYLEMKTVEAHDGQSDRQKIRDAAVGTLQSLIVETVGNFVQKDRKEVLRDLSFQYHDGATLLIVIGPRNDVEVVRKMINALMTDSNSVRVDGFRTDSGEARREETEPLSVQIFQLKNASMGSATGTAASLLSDPRSRVIPDLRTKTLVVTATKADLITVKKAIEELDAASKPYIGDKPVAR